MMLAEMIVLCISLLLALAIIAQCITNKVSYRQILQATEISQNLRVKPLEKRVSKLESELIDIKFQFTTGRTLEETKAYDVAEVVESKKIKKVR